MRTIPMPITDFHCDVLWKLLEQDRLSFKNNPELNLDVSLPRLQQAGSILQTFAIFVSGGGEPSMLPILRTIDLFHQKVLTAPGMRFVRSAADLQAILRDGGIGAMLSLEGADGLQGDMAMLRILFELGVRAVGLTWNNGNWGADGVMEPRGGGLTAKGREFVAECNRIGLLLDVSHLSERAFWDMADVSGKPVIASHSNAKAVCRHPRNLSDEQIKALIAMDGLIGITFVPQFVREGGQATVDDVLLHVERVCELGGDRQLMFGSDFDGIESHVAGLSHPGELVNLKEALIKHYKEEQVRGFLAGNTLRFLSKHLPAE
ncbi:dipeptidase [Paenibacillus nasutitermitis]|uniref:Diguanylate cyclase n=1 Tax=Paenibacillus nasutitermitis TaxID=1652958 RepID=A0A917DTL5_9BACL|nr:dipeptidase [Paenibacillus nasutitermitis]GGD67686.1 diguanylate cyclase [Paenibacillus nasutitermitis]